MTNRSAEKTPSPFVTWKNRFREDFRFSPGRWSVSLGASLAAILSTFVTQLPRRLVRLGRHLTLGLVEVFRPPERNAARSGKRAEKRDPLGRRLGIWLLLALFRTLDLISFGEIVDFLTNLVKLNTRPLSREEIEEARRVFGDGLDYGQIRIDEWSLIAHFGAWSYTRRWKKRAEHMAMTIYNTIHFSRRLAPEPGNNDMTWLVHELTHAAQCRHTGGGFMLESLIAQGGAGYDYGGPAALFRRDLRDFNREQQGDIAKHYYQALHGKRELSAAERKEYERLIGQLRVGKL